MRKFILTLALVLFLCSCQTPEVIVEYVPITPTLPSFNLSIPTRPQLDANDLEQSTLDLIDYSKKLEAEIERFSTFYNELRTTFLAGNGG